MKPATCWLVAIPLLAAGCTTVQSIQVDSRPPGARILIDDEDSGLTTPAEVSLTTSQKQYTITLEKAGYNPVTRKVRRARDVDVIDADEVAARVLCAPCCLGLTLPGLLTPVSVDTLFVPTHLDTTLDVAGQGLKLDIEPRDAELYANGRLVRPLEGVYLILKPGDHEIEVRKNGYRPYVRVVHVDELIYQDLQVRLDLEGQGIVLDVEPDGAKVYVDDQYQGILEAGARRFRTTPGPHSLRIELEGYLTFEDVVTIGAEENRSMNVTLRLAGQGIIVHKPQGLRKDSTVQILVNGAIQATAFEQPLRLEPGTHGLEIRVAGHEPWSSTVRVSEGLYLEVEPVLQREKRKL